MECKTESLCLFDEKQVQVDITGNIITDYHPVTTLTAGGPIEFKIPGSVDEYIDLGDTQLLVRAQILRADGTNLQTDDKIICYLESWQMDFCYGT